MYVSNDEAEHYFCSEGLNKFAEFLRDALQKGIASICNYRFVKLREEAREREGERERAAPCSSSRVSSISEA